MLQFLEHPADRFIRDWVMISRQQWLILAALKPHVDYEDSNSGKVAKKISLLVAVETGARGRDNNARAAGIFQRRPKLLFSPTLQYRKCSSGEFLVLHGSSCLSRSFSLPSPSAQGRKPAEGEPARRSPASYMRPRIPAVQKGCNCPDDIAVVNEAAQNEDVSKVNGALCGIVDQRKATKSFSAIFKHEAGCLSSLNCVSFPDCGVPEHFDLVVSGHILECAIAKFAVGAEM